MQRLIFSLILFVLGLIQGKAQDQHTITIEFENLKSDNGKIYVALYNKEDQFLRDKYKGVIVPIEGSKAVAVFEAIPTGEYAVSSFHDENNNQKMDTKLFGIPKEPIGVSNNAKGLMGPPKYKDAKFDLHADIALTIKMN